MSKRSFAVLSLVVILCLGYTKIAVADQYRSKLYLDPGKQLEESISLSLGELEKQFDTMSDAYSKSSAGRHLARHYVNEKNYAKAIEFYQQALKAEGLSVVANQEMLQELAMVYVFKKDYHQAINTFKRLRAIAPELNEQTLILMAQAQSGVGDHVGATKTLDDLIPKLRKLSEAQLNIVLALYYKGANYRRCETVLQRLIAIRPQSTEYWRQLTSIYLAQGKQKKALDQLELARQKKMPFRSQDVLLLADLYVASKVAEKGARVLEQAIATGEIENNGKNNKRLFEFWLQAREKAKATAALQKTLGLSYSAELYLRLAQLQMEQQQWQAMNRTMLNACRRVLADKYVSRANLLLGVSQLKMGDRIAARKSFINATLIAGEGSKAQQWLAFINAAPPSDDEVRVISKPCVPKAARVQYVKGVGTGSVDVTDAVVASDTDSGLSDGSLQTKTVSSQGFFYTKLSAGGDDLRSMIRRNAAGLGAALVMSGGSIDGSLQILIDSDDEGSIVWRLAFPYRGQPAAKGRYRTEKSDDFVCVYKVYQGPGEGLVNAWEEMTSEAASEGYSLSGQRRIVINMNGGGAGQVSAELQLGIL